MKAKLKANAISNSVGISACGKGKQWPQALSLLTETLEAKMERNIISCNGRNQQVRLRRTVDAGFWGR